MTPAEALKKIKQNMKREWKLAFFSVLICGLLVHFKVFAGDFPNHDGLSSMYFDQNMITSGRWFLGTLSKLVNVLLGSSHFSLPLFNGVFCLLCMALFCCVSLYLAAQIRPVLQERLRKRQESACH